MASLRYRKAFLGVAVAILLFSGWIATGLGSEFVPSLDEQDLAIQSLRIPATSLSQSIEMQKRLETRLLEFPEVETVFARIGTAEVATDPMPPNIADGYIIVKPKDQWPDPSKSKPELLSLIHI